ncbi:MAG: hypothetical protein O7E52_02710 [Candidatus Poribacteria bacterium]|nr:hypothetical protein [Candidatus Poribacteria bacterium]
MNFRAVRQFGILTFCTAYLLIQAAFIIQAHFAIDKRFGFWMFAESSRYKAELYRLLKDGRLVKTRNGKWSVRAGDGQKVSYSWQHYVRDFGLRNLEKLKRARVGMEVTLKYLQYALNYVIDRMPEDQETVKLVLKVQYKKAGGLWQYATLESRSRALSALSR